MFLTEYINVEALRIFLISDGRLFHRFNAAPAPDFNAAPFLWFAIVENSNR
jgi:hypothetical protein